MAQQLEGLTGAINAIHNPEHLKNKHTLPVVAEDEERFGRHSDLKPDNILWFQTRDDPRGIFIVTDLGLSTFNRKVSRSIQPGSSAKVPEYRAPECDIKGANATRGTDVWTLGCIFLNVMAWLLGGPDLVREFEKLRISPDHLSGSNGPLFFDFIPNEPGSRNGRMCLRKSVDEVCGFPPTLIDTFIFLLQRMGQN